MVRALWSAASGMMAQQTCVDTISNNIANVNTVSYKAETNEFKSLLYQTLQTKTTSANGANKPVGSQVGLGVRNASISTDFSDGTPIANDSDTAFAISGKGFFGVKGTDGNTYYTRNGDFLFAIGTGGTQLTTTDGLPVLNTAGNPITFANTYATNQISVSSTGELYYTNGNTTTSMGIQIGLFQFSNPSGLDKKGDSLYAVTDASGAVINESTGGNVVKSIIKQNYLEGSNVNVADEMVNLIVSQRAYELNSKAIQAADDMMQKANNLRG